MQLHQLLRHIVPGTAILIFDLEGNLVERVRTKSAINIDLYEYDICEIASGPADIPGVISAIYITLVK